MRQSNQSSLNAPLLFLLFFISGFASLVYQVIWTRMAFASFGIITPVLSVVISVFMLGLSVGSWAGGRWVGSLQKITRRSAVLCYAAAELFIGIGAFAVPKLFHLGEHLLLPAGQSDSASYLALSAVVLALSILPWCLFMGATFPFMMAYVRERAPQTTGSFSYLYLANVLGAMSGTLLTALVLVESLGFRHSLWVAAVGNFSIAGISAWLGLGQAQSLSAEVEVRQDSTTQSPNHPTSTARPRFGRSTLIPWLLFVTGFASIGMEVVWTRAFAPVLKTEVYSFALIVATYLGATFLGSLLYRYHLRKNSAWSISQLLAALCGAAFLPVLANDPHFVQANWMWYADPKSVALLLASISPFCALLGYLTPGLVDEYARGLPSAAGRAYALNVLGCILGPLFASYLLLPHIGERYALLLLGLPFFLFYFAVKTPVRPLALAPSETIAASSPRFPPMLILSCAVFACALLFSRSYEERVLRTEPHAIVRRDYAAAVLSFGEARDKRLLVNGIGMTSLTPITKFMVHLPLLFHSGHPQSALIICFGMGTTYRSALSWDIETTSVELVPSVKAAFGFYHADASSVSSHAKGRIIIDDGRRYLKRTRGKFDVIVVDPPPPPEAACSSLLYSEEFYELAKQHLQPNGILQVWAPEGNVPITRAVVRSVCQAFPYVRAFHSVEGWGHHLLASLQPIEPHTAVELAARLPVRAAKDLLEWAPAENGIPYLDQVVSQESPIEYLLSPDPKVCITDDRPYNEYFLMRQTEIF